MGRQVIADVSLETYLKSLCNIKEIITGLIIGQPSKTSKDNVVHFTRTPMTGSETGKIETLSQVDLSTFANHVADVLKMLPGGMFILGVFVVGPNDVFSDNVSVQKLKTLIVNLQHTIKGNKILLGDSDSFDNGEKLVLWYSSLVNSINCKIMSADSAKGAQLKGVDFKFQPKLAQNWVTFETFYKLNELLPIEDVEKASNEDVLLVPLKYLNETLDKSKVFFNGTPHDKTSEVSKLITDSKIVQAQIFKTCDPDDSEKVTKAVEKANHTIMAQGFLSSRTFVPNKATIFEAETFIKQDILRTLATRVQILSDSLVDTKVTVGEVVINEPPRRIYFPIAGTKDSILFSDYLFPNESIETILQQIKQNLDCNLKPDQIQLNIEVVCDNQVKAERKISDAKMANGKNISDGEKGKMYFIMIIVAVLVLIASIIAHFYLN